MKITFKKFNLSFGLIYEDKFSIDFKKSFIECTYKIIGKKTN